MALQARAEATRRRILDSAVDLFDELGYGETGLADVLHRAGVSKGAFYYHFDSKEDLARTIIIEGWPKALAVIDGCLESPSPGLENIIVMTYALSSLMKRDKFVWIANHLNQAFGQLSETGREDFEAHATQFAERLANKLSPADLLDDITPRQVADMVWVTLHGCHLLSDAMKDSVSDRLSESWVILLRGIVPDAELPYFQQFVTRTASRYRTPVAKTG